MSIEQELNAPVRPGSTGLNQEEPGKFPFEAFEFDLPTETAPTLYLKDPWKFKESRQDGVDDLADEVVANTAAIATKITGSTDQIAKAWVNFNGTGVVAIRDSYNVSSITDNGTGDYTVNFASSLSDANYNNVFGGAMDDASGTVGYWIGIKTSTGAVVTKTTSALRILAKSQSFAGADLVECNVAIFGS